MGQALAPALTPFSTHAPPAAAKHQMAAAWPVRGALLFGSQTRGSASAGSDTDVDVLLSGEPGDFVATKLGSHHFESHPCEGDNQGQRATCVLTSSQAVAAGVPPQ